MADGPALRVDQVDGAALACVADETVVGSAVVGDCFDGVEAAVVRIEFAVGDPQPDHLAVLFGTGDHADPLEGGEIDVVGALPGALQGEDRGTFDGFRFHETDQQTVLFTLRPPGDHKDPLLTVIAGALGRMDCETDVVEGEEPGALAEECLRILVRKGGGCQEQSCS